LIKKVLLLIVASCLLLAGTAHAQEPLRLDGLLAEAESSNPELAAMKSRYESALERVPQAGAFDDPRLSLGLTNVVVDGLAFDKEPMTMKEVGLSQMFPFFGKRALKSEAALHEARARQDEYRDKRLMVRSEVKKVYYELYSVKKGKEVVEKNLELMGIFRKVAETRYSVGKGTMRDVLKAQVEYSMLLEKKISLEREENTKRAFLGSLLGRRSPPEGVAEDISATKLGTDRDALKEDALKDKPALKAAEARINESGAMVALANKAFYPDFEVKVSYGQRDRLEGGIEQSDMVSAMVSMNVPVWWGSKLRPAVREAVSDKAMAENEAEAVKTEISYRVDSLLSEVEQDDRVLKLYKDTVIPQATEDLNSALAGYEVGREDFLTLLDSRRALFDYELGYYNMLAEREKAVAELEAATGVEF